MKLLSYMIMSLLFWASNSIASFSTPKILNQTGGFYYHQILPTDFPDHTKPQQSNLALKSLSKPNREDTVFILGGGPGFSSWNLEPIQQKIAQLGYPVYLMDMIGIGENKSTRPGKTLDAWINQIHQLKAEVSPNQPVTLVAHSWGALMAMLFTREYPDDIAKIILLNPVDPQKKAMENLTDEIHSRNTQEVNIKWDDESAWEQNTSIDMDNIQNITLRQIQQVLPTYFLDYEQGQKYASQFTVNDFDIDLNIQAWKEYDANPVLFSQIESWQKPIDFLECKQDYLMPYNLNAMQPNMTLRSVDVIDQCGHFPWIEQPKAFYDYLSGYLKK